MQVNKEFFVIKLVVRTDMHEDLSADLIASIHKGHTCVLGKMKDIFSKSIPILCAPLCLTQLYFLLHKMIIKF